MDTTAIRQCASCDKRYDLIQIDCKPQEYICVDCLDVTVIKFLGKAA